MSADELLGLMQELQEHKALSQQLEAQKMQLKQLQEAVQDETVSV
jgi:hypothetical protein